MLMIPCLILLFSASDLFLICINGNPTFRASGNNFDAFRPAAVPFTLQPLTLINLGVAAPGTSNRATVVYQPAQVIKSLDASKPKIYPIPAKLEMNSAAVPVQQQRLQFVSTINAPVISHQAKVEAAVSSLRTRIIEAIYSSEGILKSFARGADFESKYGMTVNTLKLLVMGMLKSGSGDNTDDSHISVSSGFRIGADGIIDLVVTDTVNKVAALLQFAYVKGACLEVSNVAAGESRPYYLRSEYEQLKVTTERASTTSILTWRYHHDLPGCYPFSSDYQMLTEYTVSAVKNQLNAAILKPLVEKFSFYNEDEGVESDTYSAIIGYSVIGVADRILGYVVQ